MKYLSWNLRKTHYQNLDLFSWLVDNSLRELPPTELAPKDLAVDVKI